MKKIFNSILALAASVTMFTGCFNLDEIAYSEIVQSQFKPGAQDVAALVGTAYSAFGAWCDWYGLFDALEEPADVVIVPTRPNGWDDGGVYKRMHRHTWYADDPGSPASLYGNCYDGINSANRVLGQLESGELPAGDMTEALIDELKAVRAVWYSILLDSHGNVPVVTSFGDTEVPSQVKRESVYKFVVDELSSIIEHGLLTESNGGAVYGRLNMWGVKMALMRVYLNAEVYVGEPQYDKALALAEDVIQNGPYSLSADFSDNFKVDTDASNTEVIFAIPYDNTYTSGGHEFSMGMKWYPPSGLKDAFGATFSTWGGGCGNPQFINSYQSDDARKEKTWFFGKIDRKDGAGIAWWNLNYLPSLSCVDGDNSMTSVDFGCRQRKYEPDVNATYGNRWGNDVPYFRLAEAYYTAAECILRGARSANNTTTASEYVNAVRARISSREIDDDDLRDDSKMAYGKVEWGALTKEIYDECVESHDWSKYAEMLEESQDESHLVRSGHDLEPVELGGMYDEWGWEFALEGLRRQQMIRFGTFNNRNWFNHDAESDNHTALFPIDKSTLSTNDKIGQNPGYDSATGIYAEDVAITL